MFAINSLSQFIQSNSEQFLTGLFTLIGALIGAAAAIIGIMLLLRYYKEKEERDRKKLLKGVYNALKSEIETNRQFFEYGVGKKLEETDKPMFDRAVIDFRLNVMYKANAQIICHIQDFELIKEIVRLYGLWGGLKDIIRKHSAEIEKYINVRTAYEEHKTEDYQLKRIEHSIKMLTEMMRICYTEVKRQTELVLQKLNTQIIL